MSRYGGPNKRRSPRCEKRFRTTMHYQDYTSEMRTIDVSEHGVLIPKRTPPPIGAHVTLTLTIRDDTSVFEGAVTRHTKCVVNGTGTAAIGIDVSSPEYQEFVRRNILLSRRKKSQLISPFVSLCYNAAWAFHSYSYLYNIRPEGLPDYLISQGVASTMIATCQMIDFLPRNVIKASLMEV